MTVVDVEFGVFLIFCRGTLSYRRMSYQRIPLLVYILGRFPVGFGFRGKFLVMEKMPRSWIVLVVAPIWLPF